MSQKHKILVAGCGSIGQRHARLLSEREDVELYLVDVDPNNVKACTASASAARACSSYEDALRRGMDGVFVCTPNHLHVDMAISAFESGACVMLEKPVADTVSDAVRLLERQECTGKTVLVGYVGRFDTNLRLVKELVESGDLGQVLYASASVYTYATLRNAKTDYRLKKRWSLVGDYTHDIDYLLHLVGPAKQVAAMGATKGDQELVSSPNIFQILLNFKSEALGSVHMDYVRDPEKRSLELVGDRGSVELDMIMGIVRVYRVRQEGFTEISRPFIRDVIYRDQIENFLGVINGTCAPVVSLRDGLEVLKVAEAAIESASTGKFVDIK